MKTILLVPLKNSEDILDDWFKFVHKLEPKPERIIFCENNSTDKTLSKIRLLSKLPFDLIRFWTRPWKEVAKIDRYLTIAVARQFLLTKARYLDPDYAIFLDDDVFPKMNPNMIESLTTWEVDIIGGPYLRLFPFGIYIGSLWRDATGRHKWTTIKKIRKALDEPMATSAGCLCLSRKAIQDRRLNFYPRPKPGASEDFGYCFKARELGYKIYLDGLLTLTHRLRQKKRAWMYGQDGKFIYEE